MPKKKRKTNLKIYSRTSNAFDIVLTDDAFSDCNLKNIKKTQKFWKSY